MSLDPLFLSRLQFAWVIAWHFLLPAFTVGLASYIAVLEGLPSSTPAVERLNGFKDGVKGNSKIEVVAEQAADWMPDKAQTAFAAMLQPEFLLHGATASTGGCAVLVVLNGAIRRELGAAGSFNAPGNALMTNPNAVESVYDSAINETGVLFGGRGAGRNPQ